MNSDIETNSSRMDTFKLGLALLIILAGLVGFYVYADFSLLYRVIALIASVGVSIAIAMQTAKGRQIWGYFHDAQIEVRKVVWPTKQETTQTTLGVIVVVIIVGILLWLFDMLLSWAIGTLYGVA